MLSASELTQVYESKLQQCMALIDEEIAKHKPLWDVEEFNEK